MLSESSYIKLGGMADIDAADKYTLERAKVQHRKLFLAAVSQIAVVSVLATVYVPKHWEIFFTSFLITFVSNYLVAALSFKNRTNFIRLIYLLFVDGLIVFLLFWNLLFYRAQIGFMLFEFAAVELALFFISLATSIIIQALVGTGGRTDREVMVPTWLKFTVWGIIWVFHLFIFELLYLYRTVRVGGKSSNANQ